MPTAATVEQKKVSHRFSVFEVKRKPSILNMNLTFQPLQLESRRYIGCKQKLIEWIFGIIQNETKEIKTATDIFAGTGVVAKKMLGLYDNVIINDFQN